MKAGEIMTRDVVFCRKDTDLATAMRYMLDNRIGTLPVLDAHGRLAGILTDRDVAAAAATRGRNAAHIAVHEAMTPRPRCCVAGDEVTAALKQMEEGRVRRLPVVDHDLRLAGIIALDDIVLRAVDRPGGIAPADLVDALARICSHPRLEPEIVSAEMYVSG